MMTRFEKKKKWCQRMAHVEVPSMNVRRIAKNSIVLYVRMMAVMLVSLYTSRVLLSALGVANYGLYHVASATVLLFCFLNGSLGMASSRFLTVEMGKGTIGSLKRVFSTLLSTHLIVALLLVVVLESVGMAILNQRLNIEESRVFAVRWAFHCGVFTTFLSMTQVPYTAVIVAHEKMSAFAFMSLYDVFVKLAIVYLLFILPIDTLIAYSTLLALTAMSTIIIYRTYCIRNFSEARYRRYLDVRILRGIGSFVGWQMLSQMVIMFVNQGLVILNQRFFGPTLVAAVALSNSVSAHLQSFINNFKAAANPQIIKLYASGNQSQAKKLLIDTITLSICLFLALGMPLWFYAPEVLSLWLGENVPPYTTSALRVAMIGSVGMLFDYSFFVIVYADGKMRNNTICDLITYVSACGVAILMMSVYANPFASVVALAGACLVQGFIQKPILLHYVAGYGVRDYCKVFVPFVVAFLITVAPTAVLHSNLGNSGLWCMLGSCCVSVLLNCLLIFTFVIPVNVQTKFPELIDRFGMCGHKVSRVVAWYVDRINCCRVKFRTICGMDRQ